MARTIDEGFRDFNSKLSLKKSETQNLKNHRASIKACLESNFNMKNFFRSGSIGNGTNVNGYSDTDYFASIPRVNLKNDSSVSLRKIKEVLKARFPNTNIYVDSPSVVIKFGTVASENTEIIPADYLENQGGVNIYEIPNKKSGWIKTSPKASNDYVTKLNSDLYLKVKPLIRFIKAWKYYNNVPISSYYLEMKVAKYTANETSILYIIDLKRILKSIIDSGLAKIVNPTGVGGYIYPCITEAKKTEALSKLNTAYTRICNAYSEEDQGNIKNTFYWLNLTFGEKFPPYYN